MSRVCEHYFGGCPHCGEGPILNVGGNHYGHCLTHRVRWNIGYNLFSGWKDESPEQHASNLAILEPLTEVTPLDEGEPIPDKAGAPIANDNRGPVKGFDPTAFCSMLSSATGLDFRPSRRAVKLQDLIAQRMDWPS